MLHYSFSPLGEQGFSITTYAIGVKVHLQHSLLRYMSNYLNYQISNSPRTPGIKSIFPSMQSSLTRYSLPQLNLTQSASVLTSLVYDSVVSIALALNATASTNLTQLEDDISQSPARIRTVGKVLSQNINKTAFQGYSVSA